MLCHKEKKIKPVSVVVSINEILKKSPCDIIKSLKSFILSKKESFLIFFYIYFLDTDNIELVCAFNQ